MTEKRRLEELLDYPCDFTFRIVARQSSDLCETCRDLVEGTLGRRADKVIEQPSKNGAYASIRVSITVETADEIRSVYQALRSIEGLQLLL